MTPNRQTTVSCVRVAEYLADGVLSVYVDNNYVELTYDIVLALLNAGQPVPLSNGGQIFPFLAKS